MGRKPKAAKAAEASAKMPEILNPSKEMVASQPKMQMKSTGLSLRKNICATKRRSERLRNFAPPAQNKEIEHVVEEINLCESEKEDEPHVEENLPKSMSAERSLEEKINYLDQAIEELKSKVAKRYIQSDNPAANLKYKSLYIDSQKKIEVLTNENRELSKKLEVALGKIEAYGEASRVCSEVLGKLKDAILISNLAKATETAMNLSSHAVLGRFSSPDDTVEPNAAVLLQAPAKRNKRAGGNKGN